MFAAVDPISAATQEFWCNVRTEFELLGIKLVTPCSSGQQLYLCMKAILTFLEKCVGTDEPLTSIYQLSGQQPYAERALVCNSSTW